MLTHYEWKKINYPIQYDPIKNILAKGILYSHKRDIKHRPIIVMKCNMIIQNEVSFSFFMIFKL